MLLGGFRGELFPLSGMLVGSPEPYLGSTKVVPRSYLVRTSSLCIHKDEVRTRWDEETILAGWSRAGF